ncbi:MAG: hypothetical protein BWX79_02816 [Alphaproteobacteria bacterium ADurb.Bin100]|nr:MAG: hypothetical protein BWX79_02816 [Alphaproteobacteria bacterium ADurb.Bin100]
MSSTRTVSPYFSPNSIMAPVFCADSMSITRAWVGTFITISALTRSSISRIWTSVSGALCVKSKRVRSALTSEPFCCTWPPSTSRSALCIRWVTEWFRTVAPRTRVLTRAATWSPTLSVPSASVPWWPNTSDLIFCVSATSKRADPLTSSPSSPTWPPLSA